MDIVSQTQEIHLYRIYNTWGYSSRGSDLYGLDKFFKGLECNRGFGNLGGILLKIWQRSGVEVFFNGSGDIVQVKMWVEGGIFSRGVWQRCFGHYSNFEQGECMVGGRLNKTRENVVEGLRGIKNSAVCSWRGHCSKRVWYERSLFKL